VQQLVLLVQATLLVNEGPAYVAEGFISSRLGKRAAIFGCLTQQLSVAQMDKLLARAWP
jgi:hypothetical protein